MIPGIWGEQKDGVGGGTPNAVLVALDPVLNTP